jgi:HAD superfamily hydrolase (TIGR01459 family)
MTQRLDSLEALAERYRGFLIDQFGVLMDSKGAYPFAPAALEQLARRGARIVLLSNSGKRGANNEARLTKFGFARENYLSVQSSGETAFAEISRRIGKSLRPGARIWIHTTDDTSAPLAGLDLTPVPDPAGADALLIAGCRPWAYSLEDYREWLRPAAQARKLLFCSNPDVTMLTGDGLAFAAGRVARQYEEMGGPVEWFGKPYPAIYREALQKLSGIERGRIVCIGDSPAHDIVGGRRAGLATALTLTGVHAAESEEEVLARCEALNAPPDFLLPRFQF